MSRALYLLALPLGGDVGIEVSIVINYKVVHTINLRIDKFHKLIAKLLFFCRKILFFKIK